MKEKTKHRIIIACVGAPLSVLTTFVGAGLTGWVFQFHQFGIQTPEMFGWIGLFIIFGGAGLLAAAPALLIMAIFSIVRCRPLGRQLSSSAFLPFALGTTAVIMHVVMNPRDMLYLD